MCSAVRRAFLRGLLQQRQTSWKLPFGLHAVSELAVPSFLYCNRLFQEQSASIHFDSSQSIKNPLITVSENPDTLYKQISILVKGHEKQVLDSYEYFAVLAAKELGIPVDKVVEPRRKIERFTLLKSIHIHKKHRVQYEMRTLYRCIELKHLTGSTADVYLEYIQRNVPEGVALEIKKTTLEKLPEHIKNPIWDAVPPPEQTATSNS